MNLYFLDELSILNMHLFWKDILDLAKFNFLRIDFLIKKNVCIGWVSYFIMLIVVCWLEASMPFSFYLLLVEVYHVLVIEFKPFLL